MLPVSVEPRAKMKTLPAHSPFFRSSELASWRTSSRCTCSTGTALTRLAALARRAAVRRWTCILAVKDAWTSETPKGGKKKQKTTKGSDRMGPEFSGGAGRGDRPGSTAEYRTDLDGWDEGRTRSSYTDPLPDTSPRSDAAMTPPHRGMQRRGSRVHGRSRTHLRPGPACQAARCGKRRGASLFDHVRPAAMTIYGNRARRYVLEGALFWDPLVWSPA